MGLIPRLWINTSGRYNINVSNVFAAKELDLSLENSSLFSVFLFPTLTGPRPCRLCRVAVPIVIFQNCSNICLLLHNPERPRSQRSECLECKTVGSKPLSRDVSAAQAGCIECLVCPYRVSVLKPKRQGWGNDSPC